MFNSFDKLVKILLKNTHIVIARLAACSRLRSNLCAIAALK